MIPSDYCPSVPTFKLLLNIIFNGEQLRDCQMPHLVLKKYISSSSSIFYAVKIDY